MKVLNVNISFCLVLVFISSQEIFSQTRSSSAQDSLQPKRNLEIINQLDEKMSDPSIYWGIGSSRIMNKDIVKAGKEAKKSALSDLAQKIRTRVISDVKSTISENQASQSEVSTHQVSSSFNETIESYSDIVVQDVNWSQPYLNYPIVGYISYFVSVSKDSYTRMVKEKLENEKSMVITPLKAGNNEFDQKNFMVALNDWISAKSYLIQFFKGLPLQYDCENNGSIDEVNSYLETRIDNFFGNINFTFLDSDITYNANGKLSQEPVVVASYYDNVHGSTPVDKLPLIVGFVKGKGEIEKNIITSIYGQVEMQVTSIDASNKSTIISIGVDKERIEGLSEFRLPNLPSITIKLEKIKTVAVVISSSDKSNSSIEVDLRSSINSVLDDEGFNPQKAFIQNRQITKQEIYTIGSKNADYIVFVKLVSHASTNIGGIENMWQSKFSGYLSLYKLPLGNEIRRINLDTFQGFGVSKNLANQASYDKLKKSLIYQVNHIISTVK